MKTIAIVGGGAAGISTLHTLVETLLSLHSDEEIKIVLFEKSDTIGTGLAYSREADDAFLLNLPYNIMSPIPKQKDHFAKWLNDPTNEPKWKPYFPDLDIKKNEYLPRRLFGLYLTDLAYAIQRKAKENNITVEFVKQEVTNIVQNPDKELVIHTNVENEQLITNSVVLCTGHLPPTQRSYLPFKNLKNYYETPWEIKVNDIPIDKDVLILGTRLTAIDAILARSKRINLEVQGGYSGKVGKILAFSRSGHIPRVISDTSPDYVRRELTLESIDNATNYGTQSISLKEVKRSFKAEIKRAYLTLENLDIDFRFKDMAASYPLSIPLLEEEIADAKAKVRRPWQTVLFSVYPIVPHIWEALDNKSKKEFIEKYYSIWMTFLAAFPIQNAEKILTLCQNGILEIIGGLQEVNYNSETAEFTVSLIDGRAYKGEYIINATGQGHDITLAEAPLIKNLLVSRYIYPHPLGGVVVDFKTLRVISAQGKIPLYIIGDQTWGACMATADLSQIANNQVPRVVNSIVKPKQKALSVLIRKDSPIFQRHQGQPKKDLMLEKRLPVIDIKDSPRPQGQPNKDSEEHDKSLTLKLEQRLSASSIKDSPIFQGQQGQPKKDQKHDKNFSSNPDIQVSRGSI